ncbi:ankyrin repeat-containing domain protein [Annulohypoxylon nitens]|nr:ankyrin repeat-containing domain protein [Annulohypoxylon nitens]
MHLFNFSPEVVELIFEEIANSRSLKRFMRLRLVNRQFKYFVDNAIFRLHLFGVVNVEDDLSLTRRSEWDKFAIQYLAYHVWIEKKSTTLRGRIRRAAVAISEKVGDTDESSVKARVESLCRLSLSNGTRHSLAHTLFAFDSIDISSYSGPDRMIEPPSLLEEGLEMDLCIATVYLGYRSLVESYISRGYQLFTAHGMGDVYSVAFGNAYSAALERGDLSMLRLLLSSDPDYNQSEPLDATIQIMTIRRAGLLSYKDMFDFALDSRPIDLGPSERDDSRDRLSGHVGYESLRASIRLTNNPNIFKRGASIFKSESKIFYSTNGTLRDRLYEQASFGHVDMVRFFLNQPPWPKQEDIAVELKRTDVGILKAVEGGNLEIVKMFLDHGATVNSFPAFNTALMAAARLSRLAIAKVLLEAGAKVDEGYPPPIVMAVWKENMDMFRLLRQFGARLDTPETGNWAMAIAQCNELESMVDVLVKAGVERGAMLRRCHGVGEVYQHTYIVPRNWRETEEYWESSLDWM